MEKGMEKGKIEGLHFAARNMKQLGLPISDIVTAGSGYFVTVTFSPDPVVTLCNSTTGWGCRRGRGASSASLQGSPRVSAAHRPS